LALTEYKKQKFSRTFKVLDRNGNGVLDWEDFTFVAFTLQQEMNWEDDAPKLQELLGALQSYWERMLELMDTDGDGTIDAVEYLRFYSQFAEELPRLGDKVPEWALDLFQALHRAVDFDNDGCISPEEYALYLKALGSSSDPQAAFNHFDLDGDGLLDIDELEVLIRQYLTSDNPMDPGNWFVDGGGGDWA